MSLLKIKHKLKLGGEIVNIYVCNTFSDYISEIDIKEFKENKRINLSTHSRIGPHGISRFNQHIITANNYSNDITIINLEDYSISSFYIGSRCNDVKVYEDKAYIVCGDSNDMKIFNIKEKIIERTIFCGNFPHSVDIEHNYNMILVCNMGDGVLNLIDLKEEKSIKHRSIGSYPTKAVFSSCGEKIFVCESCLGSNKNGNIRILDKNLCEVKILKVGINPVDIFCGKENIYVSNMGEGTISIIDEKDFKEVERIKVGGMPRGVIEKDNFLYIGDYFNSKLIRISLKDLESKHIYIGKEPNSMILV